MHPLLVGPITATFLCYFVLLMLRYSAICNNAVILIIPVYIVCGITLCWHFL